MSSLFGSGGTTSLFNTSKPAAEQLKNPNAQDIAIPSPPEDTVTGLEFSPNGSFIASTSWDGKVRVWELSQTGVAPKAEQTFCAAMDLCWSSDGTRIYVALIDGSIKLWDLASNGVQDHGKHEDTARTVHYIHGGNYECVVSGGWDKQLRFWDARQQQKQMLALATGEKVYGVDVQNPMAVAITANRGVIVYDLANTPREFNRITNLNLKHMFRCVRIFKDHSLATPTPSGFSIGSIEGRASINYIQEKDHSKNFTFKCHRKEKTPTHEIYPVHDIIFNPKNGTMATVGGDGSYCFWDKEARTRLKVSDHLNQSITKCAINSEGDIFAYSAGYDWSRGFEENDNHTKKPEIFLSKCKEEMKPKAEKDGSRSTGGSGLFGGRK